MNEGFTTVPWYPPGSLVKGIFVNSQGQRFINEDCYHGRVSHYAMRQTGDRIWLLQDHAAANPGNTGFTRKLDGSFRRARDHQMSHAVVALD